MLLVSAIALFLIALFLRIVPQLLISDADLSDQWFWKLFTDTLRKTKKIPPDIPQYLFDVHQWYPPVYPLLYAFLPGVSSPKTAPFYTIFLDLLNLILCIIVLSFVTHGSVPAFFWGGLIYATTPILISYNTQLNSRSFGAFLLNLLFVLYLWVIFYHGSVYLFVPIVFISGIILLTHKMTTQLMWFIFIGLFFITGNAVNLCLIPLSILSAIVLSKGFYIKVAIAHWDIVTFWNRNWRWLMAHPIKESPIYGEKGYQTPEKFHGSGFRYLIKNCGYLFGYAPSSYLAVLLCVYLYVNNKLLLSFPRPVGFLLIVLVLSIVFVLATLWIPFLKCLGSGMLYLYNTAFPSALIFGLLAMNGLLKRPPEILFLSVAIVINLFFIALFYRKLFGHKKKDEFIMKALDYVKHGPLGAVWCLPYGMSDMTAYITGKKVLTGGHGYGLKTFEPFFPRLKVPVKKVIQENNVKYMLTTENYLPENFKQDLPTNQITQFGQYLVYQF
ncbi:MAG: hypothetical protein PHG23_02885 [Candidatus Pacebacteria bacterium]|nr:hypothetical protein [Candidatus Paceibacterota bacterium]